MPILLDEPLLPRLSDAIADAEIAKAPTQNAVFDALALKQDIGGTASTSTVTATNGSTARSLADWTAASDGVIVDRWYSTLALAAAAATSGSKTLYVTKAHTVATGFTISCPLFFAGGSISVDSGQTVTISGDIVAPRATIFSGSGTVILGSRNGEAIRPEWFGVRANALTDDYAAWVKVLAAVPATGAHIDCQGMDISFISDRLTCDKPVTIEGTPDKTSIWTTATNKGIFRLTAQRVTIKNFKFSSNATQDGTEPYIDIASTAAAAVIERCYMENHYLGIETAAASTRIIFPEFGTGVIGTDSGDILVSDGIDVYIEHPRRSVNSDLAVSAISDFGIRVKAAAGVGIGDVTIVDSAMIHAKRLLDVVADGASAAVNSIKMVGGFYDQSDYAMSFRATNGGVIQRVEGIGVNPASSNTACIYLETDASGSTIRATFQDGTIYGSYSTSGSRGGDGKTNYGIYIADSSDVEFDWEGEAITGCNAAGYIGTNVNDVRIRATLGARDGFLTNDTGFTFGGTNTRIVMDLDAYGQASPIIGLVPAPDVSIKVTGVTALGSGNNQNLIMNGGFDIWQRGTSFAYSGGAAIKLADRWKGSRSSGSSGATFSRQTGFNGAQYCMRVQRDSGNSATDNLRFFTQLETAKTIPLQSRRVVVSADVRVGSNFSGTTIQALLAVGTGTDESYSGGSFTTGNTNVGAPTITPTTTGTRYAWTFFLVPSTATELSVQFNYTPTGTASTNDYFEITNIKLEEGSMGTPYAPEDPVRVLADCQRFYEKSFEVGTTPAQNIGAGTGEQTFIASVAAATTNRSPRVLFSQTKRKTAPTITLYSPSAASAQVYDQTAAGVCTAAAVVNNTQSGFHVTCTANAGTTVGGVLAYHWTADAEF